MRQNNGYLHLGNTMLISFQNEIVFSNFSTDLENLIHCLLLYYIKIKSTYFSRRGGTIGLRLFNMFTVDNREIRCGLLPVSSWLHGESFCCRFKLEGTNALLESISIDFNCGTVVADTDCAAETSTDGAMEFVDVMILFLLGKPCPIT